MDLIVHCRIYRPIYPAFSMIIATLNLRRIGLNGSVGILGKEVPPDLYKVVSETKFDYAYEGIAPGPDSNAVAKALFIAIKPVIDNAHYRYDACVENGRKGGAPKGSRNNPSGKAIQPNQRPNQYPNQEPNLYKDKDVDKDKDI